MPLRSAWDRKDYIKAKNAVEKITDQTTLMQIAVSDQCESVCITAVERLSDEGLIQIVACSAEHWAVRLAAYKQLRGEDEVYSAFADNADYFYCGSGSERRERILDMIRRLENDRFAAHVFWKSLKVFNMQNHIIPHNDSPGEDCRIDPFPPYPFGEEPKWR